MTERKKRLVFSAKKAAAGAFAFALSLSESRAGVFPFGLALCCGAREHTAEFFLGTFAASLLGGESGYFRAAAAMIVFAIKWAAKRRQKEFGTAGAAVTSIAVTAAMAVREFLAQNVIFLSITRAGATFAILPLFAVLISFYTPFTPYAAHSAGKAKRQISLLAWAFCAVRAVQIADIAPFMPSLAAGVVCTLAAGRESPFFGGMCGFACGLAAAPVYIPVMCIAGMAYGVFCPDVRWFALIFSTLISLSSGVYLATFESAFPQFYNLVAGSAAFGIIAHKLPPVAKISAAQSGNYAQIKKMSAAFAAISEAFYTQPPAAVPRHELCAQIKPQVFSKCAKCRKYGSCRIDKYDYVNHLTALAALAEPLPPHMGEQCDFAPELVRCAISAAARLRGKAAVRDRAESYMSFARILSSAGEAGERDRACDPAAASAVRREFARAGLECAAVTVRGKRAPEIFACGIDLQKCTAAPEQIRAAAARALGVRMSAPELKNGNSGWEMRLFALPGLRIEYGKAAAVKAGETVCGDTAVAFESDDKRFYSLLADGMGSGADAAGASRLAALFMEKLILAGGDKKEALAMLNRMLLSRRDEVFTTVDLLEIDRMSGDACLIKAGAAPSYLFRTGKCWKIATDTPPAGVLESMKVTQTAIKLRHGDVLVMLSDGACPENGALPAPAEKRSASAYAGAILESQRPRRAADDMSVCVIKAV